MKPPTPPLAVTRLEMLKALVAFLADDVRSMADPFAEARRRKVMLYAVQMVHEERRAERRQRRRKP